MSEAAACIEATRQDIADVKRITPQLSATYDQLIAEGKIRLINEPGENDGSITIIAKN